MIEDNLEKDLKRLKMFIRISLIVAVALFILLGVLIYQTFGEEEDLGDAYTELGVMFFANGRFDIALEQFKKALKEDLKKYDERHVKVIRDYFNIGTSLLALNKIAEGKEYYHKVEGLCKDNEIKECPEVLINMRKNLNILERQHKEI